MDEVAPKVLKDAQKKLNNALVEGLKKVCSFFLIAFFVFLLSVYAAFLIFCGPLMPLYDIRTKD